LSLAGTLSTERALSLSPMHSTNRPGLPTRTSGHRDFDRKNDGPRKLFLDEATAAIVKVVASHDDDDQGHDNQH